MRKIREVLRQKWNLNKSHREVATSLGVSPGAVGSVLARAATAGLVWAGVEILTDSELEMQLYGPRAEAAAQRPLPDPVYIHTERRRPGVTLELLHLEYLEKYPAGYRYTQFCEYYRAWAKKRSLSMRQVHRAGEKLFVDYSGKRPHFVDASTGEMIPAELFVAVLGASNYTYAEASRTQRAPDWIASHMRALEYIGGVPAALVPDQLRSGVTYPSSYEPGIQRTYEEMAQHYGTAVVPARPRRPRDKAKVEVGVQVVQRWILARLRNLTFFSLDALNERIWELLEDLNDRRMRLYGASRRELYARLDRPALKALPAERFMYGAWAHGRVNVDYHVEVDHHFYSVLHDHVHDEVETRSTAATVEVYLGTERLTSHARSYERGGHTTKPEHMPKAHQKHMEWTPSRLTHWAGEIGPSTRAMVEALLVDRAHPEQAYRSCLGLLRLARRYGSDRLEAACLRALGVNGRSYRHVESILKSGLDRMAPQEEDPKPAPGPMHENIRGGKYYH